MLRLRPFDERRCKLTDEWANSSTGRRTHRRDGELTDGRIFTQAAAAALAEAHRQLTEARGQLAVSEGREAALAEKVAQLRHALGHTEGLSGKNGARLLKLNDRTAKAQRREPLAPRARVRRRTAI